MRFEVTLTQHDGTTQARTVDNAAAVRVLVDQAASIGQRIRVRPLRRHAPIPAASSAQIEGDQSS